MVGGVIGSKSLAEADLKKALLRGGLEDINELTYGDIEDFFNTAGSLLRAQCESKNSFSWARVCPPAMLCNKWSSPGYAHIVDSTEFLPPNHRSSKGQGLRKKRLAVYVAVHLSPFYAKVLDMHFAASRLSGRKKRFRRKDPLDDVSKPAKVRKKRAVGNGGKLKKSAVAAAGADARARLTDAKRVAAAAREKSAVARAAEAAAAIAEAADAAAAAQKKAAAAAASGGASAAVGSGGQGGPMRPAARSPICVLVRQNAQTRMHTVWLREPTTPLPTSSRVSVVSLTGSSLSDAARASVSIGVVLPRLLLKEALATSEAEESAATTPPGSIEKRELAVRITLGNYDRVIAFPTTLWDMSSVLALNEAIEASRAFVSWLGELPTSSALLPVQLNVLSGTTVPVAAMAAEVRADVDGRLLSECVWAGPRSSRVSAAAQSAQGSFEGCSVGMQDVCHSGQKQFLTNALLDAGLAEIQHRCVGASLQIGVLSTSQSASFKSKAGEEVALARAMTAVLEVLDQFDPAVERFVMLVNIGNTHWISATVSRD
ncbi:hypothetical protein I4F81_004330 [Pyropia yezoensis]|uniref:Uncharacterized protein n=1 Tax=Pyropia yezoensis TaxID=2788 RepID=A0ACC3BUW4_PYRYE|nr:hypothetical protein I4F81_004330 [Neopyropia yezoensis]